MRHFQSTMLLACWLAACSGSSADGGSTGTRSSITADHANAGTSATDEEDDDFKGHHVVSPLVRRLRSVSSALSRRAG